MIVAMHDDELEEAVAQDYEDIKGLARDEVN